MSERVHMTAPDGRTFTFEEWWYERAIKAEREWGQERHMGYESNLARCRKGDPKARIAIQNHSEEEYYQKVLDLQGNEKDWTDRC